ncbi:glycosyltransferase [Chroococcidiopsis sp. FACHB-1243]|uniref:glycosyltransferase family 2 protein n=1 Tax=Chroococcidiopsis sp. [FACHB-1243] TaxID=2692781 RepID=UPI001780B5E0|nr:glycosyltransferase [Chroococcidiopsis sp. [FACHB-1243]]MBD2305937.1 glycosyltransferase [Chroococcidiopsis sp. [FACHB-1243]]
MPTISVIVPAYNSQNTILETIASIQKQTFTDFELIVIDDGSSDRTLELIQTVRDPRIQVASYENGGVSVARNRGISLSTGEYITFIDADDLWTPDKLELQLAALQQHPAAGVAYSWTCFMDRQGKFFHDDRPIYFEGNVYAELLKTNFLLSGSNPLIRRTALADVGEFDPSLTHAEEWDLYLRLAAKYDFVVVPKTQIFYRQTAGSASAKIEVMEKDAIRVIDRAFQLAPAQLQYLKNQSLANLYRYLAHLYLTKIPGAAAAGVAWHKLRMAIQLQPRILLNRKVQTLLVKLLLIQLLSPKLANYLLLKITRIRASSLQDNTAA